MNPALASLGLPPDARVLVTHLDDVGMNLGTVDAWEACHAAGGLSSASVMMPCPWAPEALARAPKLGNPDLGVHLTITCEWESYRWGPFGPGRRNLLSDESGYFPKDAREHFRITAAPEARRAVAEEIRAQLDAALERWPDVTHVDSHMFALLYPPNLEMYVDLAKEYKLPCMLPGSVEAWRPWTGSDEDAEAMARAVRPALDAGIPLFDRVVGVPLSDPPPDRKAATEALIRDCVSGLNFLFLHANADTPELRGIAADWRERRGDLEVFSNPGLRSFIEAEGVRLMGMRELRDLMRSA